jgi:hypothetical protein
MRVDLLPDFINTIISQRGAIDDHRNFSVYKHFKLFGSRSFAQRSMPTRCRISLKEAKKLGCHRGLEAAILEVKVQCS